MVAVVVVDKCCVLVCTCHVFAPLLGGLSHNARLAGNAPAAERCKAQSAVLCVSLLLIVRPVCRVRRVAHADVALVAVGHPSVTAACSLLCAWVNML